MDPQILKWSQAVSSRLKRTQVPSGHTKISSALKQLGRGGVFGDVPLLRIVSAEAHIEGASTTDADHAAAMVLADEDYNTDYADV